MKSYLNALKTRLSGVTTLRHIDCQWGQLAYDQPPVKYPCALIEIASSDIRAVKPDALHVGAAVTISIADLRFNRAWLRTEYDTAVIRTHQATDWQQFESEKDVFPNLEWIPSTSPHPGADHQVFWGTVRPVNDSFWSEHRPGDRWNCKCELRQTEADATIPPMPTDADNPQPGLENNPGRDGELFSQKHPYYPSGCMSCPFAGGHLAALMHGLAHKQNCHQCEKVNKVINQKYSKQWEQNKIDYTKYKSDKDYVVGDFTSAGGFLAQHKTRIPTAKTSPNERAKYNKEIAMCGVLANNGYATIYKADVPGEFDVFINRDAADLKQTKSHNNINKYTKKAIEKQGAKYAVFCFEMNNNLIIQTVKNEWKNHGRKCLYYFLGENKIYKNWE